MNKTEINTLLANKVPEETIVLACAAGKISTIIRNTRYTINDAKANQDHVNWKELFRFMEQIEDNTQHQGRHGRDNKGRPIDG